MHVAASKLSASIQPGKGSLMHVQELLLTASWLQSTEKQVEAWHTLTQAVRVAFSFIAEDKGHGFDMHRLVQLITRKWLVKNGKSVRIRLPGDFSSTLYEHNQNTMKA
jgi:hypothetical protein